MPSDKKKPAKPSSRAARDDTPIQEPRAGRVVLIGRPNVGKSTLLNALVGEPIAIVSHHPQTTRDRLSGIVTEDAIQFVFVDTPGVHQAKNKLGTRMNHEAHDAVAGADVVVFVTDVETEAKPRVREADLNILSSLPKSAKVLCVLNKIDRVKPKSLLIGVLEALAKVRDFEAIIPISARKDDGPARVRAEVEKLLPAQPFLFESDEISDRPLRYFIREFVREQILRHVKDEVPHGVAVTVESYNEDLKVPHIKLVVHVDKDSHKGIVLGARGERMKTIAQEARMRFQELAGRKVHMEIFVRTTPKWYERTQALEDLGYGKTDTDAG
jgi:GTP-binding protein Era